MAEEEKSLVVGGCFLFEKLAVENGLKEELLEDGSDEDLDLELRLNFGF